MLMAGCASQLAVQSFAADPADISPGQSAILMVTFQGPADQVYSVVATVREAPDIMYTLNNSGNNGDAQAGDKTWSIEVTVPYEATPGDYHLDIVALDQERKIIVEKGVEMEDVSQSGTLEVTVK